MGAWARWAQLMGAWAPDGRLRPDGRLPLFVMSTPEIQAFPYGKKLMGASSDGRIDGRLMGAWIDGRKRWALMGSRSPSTLMGA